METLFGGFFLEYLDTRRDLDILSLSWSILLIHDIPQERGHKTLQELQVLETSNTSIFSRQRQTYIFGFDRKNIYMLCMYDDTYKDTRYRCYIFEI